jgi:hypothetical protein
MSIDAALRSLPQIHDDRRRIHFPERRSPSTGGQGVD